MLHAASSTHNWADNIMQTFHCTHCQNLVFFENVQCLNCQNTLAYLVDQDRMAALEKDANGLWHAMGVSGEQRAYRLCANYVQHNVCNWAVAADQEAQLCESCQLTKVIPDMSIAANKAAWYRLEVAKRRMVYTLLKLQLPVEPRRADGSGGLAFEFLEDITTSNGDKNRVLTGHDNGVITINIAEADDVLRETQRREQNEPYRTLLGHCRHEIGHYYWDLLIPAGPRLEGFRAMFGDERADYAEALKEHYEKGPPAQWEEKFVSAYASTHPWEDWAESWAHYLHMTDALETAHSTGLSLRPLRRDEPSMSTPAHPLRGGGQSFEQMMAAWLPLTYALNNLNRGLGRADSYPFVLSPAVIEKLRFVHETIREPQSLPMTAPAAVAASG
jgi:hypothetical protein